MRNAFYFRFYKRIHNDLICNILAQIAYFIYLLPFFIKKLFSPKCSIDMTSEEANSIINKYYTPSAIVPEYINPKINPKLDLSVVIPVYNHKDILENCILSIINQNTKYNYEVILVDDGSTDGADEIVRKFEKNEKVKAVFQKNGGIGAARNAGINNATGRYIMFIDCDDTVHNDIVEKLLDEAYSRSYDMVMIAHNLVKKQNDHIIDSIPNVYSKYNINHFKNGDKIINLAGLPWGKVYKRSLWNDVRFFPGYWYEDTIIQFLIFTKCEKYSYIPEILYEYLWYEKNFSHAQGDKSNYKVIDNYGILLRILEKYEENKLPFDDKFYAILLRHLSTYYYPMLSEFDDSIKSAMFVLANELFVNYRPKRKVKLPYMLRQVEKAFENNDIELWKLVSCYQ